MHHSAPSRAQASLEILILTGIGLVVLALVISSAQERLTTSESALRVQQAQASANAIARAADEVFAQGSGTRRSVSIVIPEGLISTALQNQTVVISMRHSGGLTDVLARANEQLYGAMPATPGAYTLWLTAQETSVLVETGNAAITFDPLVLVHTALLNTTNATTTQLATTATNYGTTLISLTTSLVWTATSINVTYNNTDDQAFSLSPGESRTIVLNVSIGANVTGSFSGTLNANASNGQTFQIGVIVESLAGVCAVQSCPAASSVIAYVTGGTYKDNTYTKAKLIFNPGEANQVVDILGHPWVPGTTVTLKILNPSNSTLPGYPKNLVTNSTGSFTDTLDPTGFTPGLYTAIANSSTTNATNSFTVTGCS